MKIGKKEQNFLLAIARQAIRNKLESLGEAGVEIAGEIPKKLAEKRGVFVTLKEKGELRGCIGHIKPIEPTYQSVIENAINAAFFDPRFKPLEPEELPKIRIEISILSPLEKISFEKTNQLLEYLKKNKPGLLIKKGANQATFLPQVWEELREPERFLSSLCLKAGLPPNSWQLEDVEFYQYKVQSFEE